VQQIPTQLATEPRRWAQQQPRHLGNRVGACRERDGAQPNSSHAQGRVRHAQLVWLGSDLHA
jgi:hypothetical protein